MSENQNETPTIDEAVEETRDLIGRMATSIKSVKGSQTAINAQDIPNEIRSIVGVSPVTKTYYAVRPYLSDIGDLLKPYVDFSLDTSNLTRTTGNIGWLNGVPKNEYTNTYTYKYKKDSSGHFANRGKSYTESAMQTIIEKCSELAREDFDTSKGYLTILEYQELYNEAHTRVTDYCLYLYKQVYTIGEYQGRTVYTLESDTNFARLNISAGNTLSISSIITENIPQRADINNTSIDNPIYAAANCVLYGYNYYDNVLDKMTVKRVNTINAQDFPDVILRTDAAQIMYDQLMQWNKINSTLLTIQDFKTFYNKANDAYGAGNWSLYATYATRYGYSSDGISIGAVPSTVTMVYGENGYNQGTLDGHGNDWYPSGAPNVNYECVSMYKWRWNTSTWSVWLNKDDTYIGSDNYFQGYGFGWDKYSILH